MDIPVRLIWYDTVFEQLYLSIIEDCPYLDGLF